MPTIYIDVCCLNRPFDDQSQARVRLESEAVLIVLERIQTKEWEWVSSAAVELEIEQTPDSERRARTKFLTTYARQRIPIGALEEKRAQELVGLGFHALDALHLACAESGRVDVFLTTDDRFLRRAEGLGDKLKIRLSNPLKWIEEVSEK